MKIAHLLPNLEVGGMERLVVGLARQQKATGHLPMVYCMTHGGALAAETTGAGIPVVEFAKGPGFSWSFLSRLVAQLKADRPEVLHTHNALVHHYGVAAARLAGVPVVVNTRHGYGSLHWSAKRETLFNAVLRWTDAVVLVSAGVRDYFVKERRVPTESTRVILNGTDTEVFLRHRARPGRNRPGFRFGTVGRLSAPKAHVTLVEAFARVAAVLPEAELHILGEGECRSDIQAAITEHNLHDRVILRGYSGEVADFLGSLDAFVLSSVSEGLPLVILESMAAGLPIVSTRMPGVMDVAPANEIAWYCNPGDPDALAASMIEIAGRDDLGAIGELASARAQRFSIETTWREYESLFCELLIRKRPQYASDHIKSGRESRKSDNQRFTVPAGGETTVKALKDNVY